MNNVEKIVDCMVSIEKETILVLASRMVSFLFIIIIFLGERYEYWFIFYIHCLIFKALIEYHSMLS